MFIVAMSPSTRTSEDSAAAFLNSVEQYCEEGAQRRKAGGDYANVKFYIVPGCVAIPKCEI